MALETLSATGTGPPRWRSIKFWKGEKVKDDSDDIAARWIVDDASFEIASVTTRSVSEIGTPQKLDTGSVVTSSPPRTSRDSPSSRTFVTDKTRTATSASATASATRIPFILSEKEWTFFPTVNFDLDPRSFNGSEVSSLYKDGSTFQGSTTSMESREKSISRWNTSSVVSDTGDATAAYAGATRAPEPTSTEDRSLPTFVTETLSPKVQLLHAVHVEPEHENRSEICASSCMSLQKYEPSQPNIAEKSNQLDKSVGSKETFNAEEYLQLQRKIKLNDVRKDMDDVTYRTEDEGTVMLDDDETMSKEEYQAAESLLDKILYLFTCHPKLSLFSVALDRGDDNHHDAGGETFLEAGDTDGSSNTDTEDQTLSTYGDDRGHEADHEQTDDGSYSYVTASLDSYDDGENEDTDDGTESENSRTKPTYRFSAESPQGKSARQYDHSLSSSDSGSFMDQSHIYLMMTSARQERAMKPTSEITKNGDFFVAWKERPKLTDVLDSYVVDRRVGDPSSSSKELSQEAIEEATSFGWLRHLQRQFYPTESHQLELVGNHERWLQRIQQALRNESVDLSSSLEERRAAAKESLCILGQKSADEKDNHALTFALWS